MFVDFCSFVALPGIAGEFFILGVVSVTDRDRVDILSDILLAIIDIIVGIRLPEQMGK